MARSPPSSAAVLTQVEEKIGRTLPASVREWYEMEGACQLLRQCSNCDEPLEIAEFSEPKRDTHGGGPHHLLARDSCYSDGRTRRFVPGRSKWTEVTTLR